MQKAALSTAARGRRAYGRPWPDVARTRQPQRGGGAGEACRRTHSVPDLQLDLLVVDGDHACAELDADREVVHLLEALVGELQQQARLSHAGIADDDVPGGKTQ